MAKTVNRREFNKSASVCVGAGLLPSAALAKNSIDPSEPPFKEGECITGEHGIWYGYVIACKPKLQTYSIEEHREVHRWYWRVEYSSLPGRGYRGSGPAKGYRLLNKNDPSWGKHQEQITELRRLSGWLKDSIYG